jgi:hypothetical protein
LLLLKRLRELYFKHFFSTTGRRIIILYSANWDNTRYGLAAIYRAILLTLEKLIDEESCQINGILVIVDWSEFTFKQSSWLNPRVLKLMIEGLQVRQPVFFPRKIVSSV